MPSTMHVLVLALAATVPSVATSLDFSSDGSSAVEYSYADPADTAGVSTFESEIGLQVMAQFDDRFSMTAQGLVSTDDTGQWERHLEGVYVTAQLTRGLSARAGLLPAPLESYDQSPVFELRGVDLNWRRSLGPVTVGLQPYFGASRVEAWTEINPGEPDTETILHAKNWAGLAATAEYECVTVSASYSQTEIDRELASLQPLLDSLYEVPADSCPDCAEIAARMHLKGTRLRYLTLSGQYDAGPNFAVAGYAQRRDDAAFVSGDVHEAYVSYGRRFGNLMPYVTAAIHRVDRPLSLDRLPDVEAVAALAAGIAAAMNNSTDRDSYSFGVSYELPSLSVMNDALLTVQFDRIHTDDLESVLSLSVEFAF